MGVAAKILAEQLHHYGDGHALWNPSPRDGQELSIGDVGFIDQEGTFTRFFNVMENSDSELNKCCGHLPDGFKPLKANKKLMLQSIKNHRPPGALTSSSVGHVNAKLHAGANAGIAGGGAQLRFSCSSESGAWMLLKGFSDKTYLNDSSLTKKYILDNYGSWDAFATSELGLSTKQFDIIFVKGFVKTSAWSVAAYQSGVRSAHTMALTGTVGAVGDIGFEFTVDSSQGYIFDTRFGPEGREVQAIPPSPQFPRPSLSSEKGKSRETLREDDLATNLSEDIPTPAFPRDQSVFVSYYKIKHRIWWKKIVARAGPHELPRGPDEDSSMAVLSDSDTQIEAVPLPQELHLPIDDLLGYIFENSNAEVAIASHDDLADLFYGKSWPENIAEWLQSNRPEITVDEDLLGYLSSHDFIVRRRTDALLQAVAQQDQVEQEEHDKHVAILESTYNKQTIPTTSTQTDDQGEKMDDQAPSGSTETTEGQSTTEHTLQDTSTPEAPPTEAPLTEAPGAQKPATTDAPPSTEVHYDRQLGLRSVTEGRQYGSSVQLDGKVYLGNGKKNRSISYPHVVLADHAADGCAITSLAVSISTNRLASTCEDRAVRVWDVASGALLMKLDEHRETSITATFSPDGTKLVSGGADNRGILWNLDSHAKIASLEGHTGEVWVVDYSPNGKLIATGSMDCMVKVWDGMDGKPLFTIQDHPAVVMCVRFSPDSQQIATCAENTAYLWSAVDGSPIAQLQGHAGLVWNAKFSSDGTRVITGAEDQTARIWSTEDGAELVTLAEHGGPVWAATFSPDGDDVAMGSHDGRVTVCDSYTGEEKYSFEDDHSSIVNSVEYSSDGELIIAGCADGGVKLWSATNGQFVAELLGHEDKAKNVAFSPDECHVISTSDDSTIRIWNIVDLLRL